MNIFETLNGYHFNCNDSVESTIIDEFGEIAEAIIVNTIEQGGTAYSDVVVEQIPEMVAQMVSRGSITDEVADVLRKSFKDKSVQDLILLPAKEIENQVWFYVQKRLEQERLFEKMDEADMLGV